MTNKNYTFQCLRLASICQAHGIPFEIRELWDGYQVCYPSTENRVSDAICHGGSYGHERGLLEIMGLVDEEAIGDSVEGWLTAEEVFERWKKHWESEGE